MHSHNSYEVWSIVMQHDDHIWLVVGGESWAIEGIVDGIIFLWRGYYPYYEWSAVDVSDVDWEKYTQEAVRMLEKEYGR